jgi:hypothetical protein
MERNITQFVLTKLHLKLLSEMRVSWNFLETGAPTVDPKRPYGNSDVAGDIRRIVEGPTPGEVSEPERDHWMHLHREMATALQIVLCTGAFELGEYVKTDRYDSTSWTLL